MEKTGGDGEKDQGLGTKGTAALDARKAELLRKALHYVNRPATPMTRRHADPPSRPSTHLPSGLGPFSPPQPLSPPLQNPPAPIEAGTHHNSSIIWGNPPKLNRKTPLNRAGEKAWHPARLRGWTPISFSNPALGF